jgi:hypothetical protein
VIVSNINRDPKERKEQEFPCHFECFRRLVADDALLEIMKPEWPMAGAFDRKIRRLVIEGQTFIAEINGPFPQPEGEIWLAGTVLARTKDGRTVPKDRFVGSQDYEVVGSFTGDGPTSDEALASLERKLIAVLKPPTHTKPSDV